MLIFWRLLIKKMRLNIPFLLIFWDPEDHISMLIFFIKHTFSPCVSFSLSLRAVNNIKNCVWIASITALYCLKMIGFGINVWKDILSDFYVGRGWNNGEPFRRLKKNERYNRLEIIYDSWRKQPRTSHSHHTCGLNSWI